MFNLDTRSVVFNITIVNLIFLALGFIAPQFGIDIYSLLGLHYFFSPLFKPVQLVSYMFIHADFGHLFYNTISLLLFGSLLERVWGPQRFLLFFFLTAFGAELLHIGVHAFEVYNYCGSIIATPEQVESFNAVRNIYLAPTVGASGAVFGMIAGALMLFPNHPITIFPLPIQLPVKYIATFYLLLELFRTIQQGPDDYVAHFAHWGGAIMGYFIIKWWNRDNRFLF